jgi:hypothetical protein
MRGRAFAAGESGRCSYYVLTWRLVNNLLRDIGLACIWTASSEKLGLLASIMVEWRPAATTASRQKETLRRSNAWEIVGFTAAVRNTRYG